MRMPVNIFLKIFMVETSDLALRRFASPNIFNVPITFVFIVCLISEKHSFRLAVDRKVVSTLTVLPSRNCICRRLEKRGKLGGISDRPQQTTAG